MKTDSKITKAIISTIGKIAPNMGGGYEIYGWEMDLQNVIAIYEINSDGEFLLGGYTMSELLLISALKNTCLN